MEDKKEQKGLSELDKVILRRTIFWFLESNKHLKKAKKEYQNYIYNISWKKRYKKTFSGLI